VDYGNAGRCAEVVSVHASRAAMQQGRLRGVAVWLDGFGGLAAKTGGSSLTNRSLTEALNEIDAQIAALKIARTELYEILEERTDAARKP
jgi:hypothetical protein